MTFQIERLDFDELSAFLRFQSEDAFPDLKDEKRLKMLAEKWSTKAECATCRNDEGCLVGMIAFYANGQQTEFAYIAHVYVSLDYRHQGLFAKMLQIIETYVKQEGFIKVKLEVNNDNVIAKKSYLRQGFVEDATASDNTVYMVKQTREL